MRTPFGFSWIDDLAGDLRHGGRALRRHPLFTVVALLTLALGIGANTAIFTVVNGVILRPLDYRAPERLMYLATQFPELGRETFWVAQGEYADFRQMNRSFAEVGAFELDEASLTATDHPRRLTAARVDEHLLRALAVEPAQGRLFADGETESTGALPPPLVVVSTELWQAAFGGTPIVGHTIDLDGRPHEVIGIMPARTALMDSRPDVWLPLGLYPSNRQNRTNHFLYLIGRLKDGVSPRAADAEMDVLLDTWGDRMGVHGTGPLDGHVPSNTHPLVIMPLREAVLGNAQRSIWILQVVVGLVLLIACANLANLLLARAEIRRREFALRAALGADGGRLVRQSITEGVLLALLGGALGVILASAGVRTLIAAYPDSLPRAAEIGIDRAVLLFALAVSTATGVFTGLVPVAQLRVTRLMTTLKEGAGRGDTGAPHHARRVLVTAEVALAVMVVAGAGLLLRTVHNLVTADAGFDRSRLITFPMTLPMATSEPSTRLEAYQRVLEKLRAIPGVQDATAMTGLPPNRPANTNAVEIDGRATPAGQLPPTVDYYQFVMSDYFATMGIPLVAGRPFARADAASTGRVAVINEALATRLFDGRDPIGQRIRSCCGDRNAWHAVIGVVGNIKQGGVDHDAGSELYMFVDQQGGAEPGMNVVLRTSLPVSALATTIDRIVHEVDPTVPVGQPQEMDTVFEDAISRPRLLAQLLGMFATLALLLAGIGTYGVLSFMVTQRRREIGIRMALGAARAAVLAHVLKQGARLTAAGLLLGMAGVFLANRFIASLLFGVQPTDTVTLAVVVAVIAATAALACWLPAWRASRLDPNAVLRSE